MPEPAPFHKLLEKQLSKLYPNREEISPEVARLVQMVDKTYKTFERDKQLSEHAFTISELEYKEVLKNLETQTEIKLESIQKLKEAILSLDPNALAPMEQKKDDLIGVVGFLKNQILKTKQLEAELIQAKVTAENAARVKSDFLSVMSHEIRTPLNAIIGIAHLMLSDNLPRPQLENINTLNIAAENLLDLVNDILDFSKMEEGKIVLNEKSVDLQEMMNRIRVANRAKADERGNQLKLVTDTNLPTWLLADELRLSQVMNNLVSNAIKFTRNGEVLMEVQLISETEKEAELLFSVKDTGIGIEKEKQEIIFHFFTQANSEITREFGGSGLGLAIIEHILSMMGTKIELESELGKGSRFFFKILLQKSDKVVPVTTFLPPPTASHDLHGCRILMVEDVEFNVVVAEKMLSGWNALVDIAENGLEALAKVKSNVYEIILMDLQMPVMDGYTASRKIREFNKEVPIVALTASGAAELLQKVQEAGMDALVSKPFKPAALFETIRKLVEEKLLDIG